MTRSSKPEEESKNGVDVLKPMRPLNAYLHFAKERIPQLRKQDPKLSQIDAMKLSGEQWKNISEKEKTPYLNLAEQSKAA